MCGCLRQLILEVAALAQLDSKRSQWNLPRSSFIKRLWSDTVGVILGRSGNNAVRLPNNAVRTANNAVSLLHLNMFWASEVLKTRFSPEIQLLGTGCAKSSNSALAFLTKGKHSEGTFKLLKPKVYHSGSSNAASS